MDKEKESLEEESEEEEGEEKFPLHSAGNIKLDI